MAIGARKVEQMPMSLAPENLSAALIARFFEKLG